MRRSWARSPETKLLVSTRLARSPGLDRRVRYFIASVLGITERSTRLGNQQRRSQQRLSYSAGLFSIDVAGPSGSRTGRDVLTLGTRYGLWRGW
jgi:hypothetical protein